MSPKSADLWTGVREFEEQESTAKAEEGMKGKSLFDKYIGWIF